MLYSELVMYGTFIYFYFIYFAGAIMPVNGPSGGEHVVEMPDSGGKGQVKDLIHI